MKHRIIAILLSCTLCIALVACSEDNSQKEKSDSKTVTEFQEILTKEDVQKMIDDSNSNLKKEILSETTAAINSKFKSLKLTDADKNELRQSILESLESTINAAGTTVVQQQPDQYITNVTEQYITDASESNDPPQIEDGTPIPISFDLPYTFTHMIDDQYQSVFTFVIDQAEFYAYNHQNEPYREISYPYEIRYKISGTLTRNNEDIQAMFINPPFTLIFEPYGSPMLLGQMHIDYKNNTFCCDSSLTVNLIPDRIVIKE